MALSGIDEEATNTERFIGALQSLRAVLRDFSEELRRSSERSVLAESGIERIEKAVGELSRTALEIKHHLTEARGDIDKWTPQSVTVLDPARYPLGKDGAEGGGLLVSAAKHVEKVRPTWAIDLLKFGLSSGLGVAALRAWQWLSTGH